MPFFTKGAQKDGFEGGVRGAVEAILVSPHFIFRLERQPDTVRAGNYRVTDVDLASRLSFFLWGTVPGQGAATVAAQRRLSDPVVLEKQTRRMLADPRAEALGERFAAMWLRLQDIDKVKPDPNFYPNFDDNLAGMMRKETIMFFNNLVREDRSLMDLYTANYSFMNERLARHYGITGVAGNDFRKVTYPDDAPPRNPRSGQHAGADVDGQPHLTGAARQVGHGSAARHAAAAAAAKRARPRGRRRSQGRPRADDASADGNPSREPDMQFVSPVHGSDWPVARQLRRHRPAGASASTAARSIRTAISTTGRRSRRGNELMDALMKRPTPLVRTFTENLMAYGMGRRVEYFDQPTIRAIAKKAEADGNKMSAFILGIVKSDTFRMKRADATVATDDTKAAARH